MQNNIADDPAHYEELIARQIDQYSQTEVMHDLPPIYDYLAKKYTARNALPVTGFTDLTEFYAHYFRRSLHESDSIFLASFGSGDCSLEIAIVKHLIASGQKKFFFVCLELSPILIEKARKKIDDEQLGDLITVARIDINKWNPRYSFAGVMAHHALHHFLNLEELFELIKKNLAKNGRFLTSDIIGRNGHMRWPEALQLTRRIWQRMPRKYKFNHQFQLVEDYFENRDCSTEGFEGIRAQDILPLLVKTFSFEVFFSFGNLIDPFIDRGFGPNFDPADPVDTSFIDYIQELNDQLISEGVLKPTSMTAVMVNGPVEQTRTYKHWDPAFAVRDTNGEAPVYDIDVLLEGIPFQLAPGDDPLIARKVGHYPLNQKAFFGLAGNIPHAGGMIPGERFLMYGWGYPEPHFSWSISEDAALIFPLEKEPSADLLLVLEFLPYRSTLYPFSTIDILVNGTKMEAITFDNKAENANLPVKIHLPFAMMKGRKSIEIIFLLPNRRQPQFESGDDIRSLGIALISSSLTKY